MSKLKKVPASCPPPFFGNRPYKSIFDHVISVTLFCVACRWERENYVILLELMEAEDLAMRARIDGMELLIFTSKHLSSECQSKISS